MITSEWPTASRPSRTAATWPSIMPLGPTTCAPESACATASSTYRFKVVSLSTRPRSSSTPQWPWSVNSSRQVSAISTVESPRSLVRSRSATLRMPSGSERADPTASLSSARGAPNSISPPTPALTASAAAERNESRVCCTTPGIESIGTGSSMPSATNIGNTKCLGSSDVWATNRRRAGVDRSRRGRCRGYTLDAPKCSGGDPLLAAPGPRLRSPLAPAALLARRRKRTLGAQPGGVLGQRLDQRTDRGGFGLHVDAQTEFGCGLSGLGADAGDDGAGVRLASDADQVAHRRARGEAHRVETAGLDHLAGGRRRRGSPHGPVGGDVLDLPAAFAQPLGQRLGGDVGARQQHPVHRVENAVVVREFVQQTQRRLLA